MKAVIEKLHRAKIIHGDICLSNILIDGNGHFVLTDFAFAKRFTNNNASNVDWEFLSYACRNIFSQPIYDDNQISVIEMLEYLTDAQLPGEQFAFLLILMFAFMFLNCMF